MVNIHLYSAFLTMASQSALQFCLNVTHSCTHSCTYSRRSQPRKAPASSSGKVRVRSCLAQGHVETQLGGAGDRTSNLVRSAVRRPGHTADPRSTGSPPPRTRVTGVRVRAAAWATSSRPPTDGRTDGRLL